MSNPVTRFFASRRFAQALGSVGRLMITSGTVILLLVAYQLWGTNLHTNKSQDRLGTDFARQVAAVDDGTVGSNTTTTRPPGSTVPGATTSLPPGPTPAKVAPTLAPPSLGEVIGK